MVHNKDISCRAMPYEGKEPYIFFSYCHKDADEVYPIIEKMAMKGYRIWYDNGIHPGDNWVETIASHINNCSICVAAVSRNSTESHNCRNEINFVLEYRKKMVPIILEEFRMSLGVKLQLSSCQYIKKYEYVDENVFLQKLFDVAGIDICKGEISLVEEISDEELKKEKESKNKIFLESLRKKQLEIQKKLEEGLKFEKNSHEVVSDEPEEKKKIEKTPEKDLIEEFEPTVAEEKTVRIKRKSKQEQILQKALFIHLSANKYYLIKNALTKIGRDNKKCDIVIKDKTISSLHAEIVHNLQGFYLRDADSANGTAVQGKNIEAMQPVPLNNCTRVDVAEEKCFFVSGEMAEWIEKAERFAFFHCIETDEMKILTQKGLRIGRAYAWESGTFSDRHTSREHGEIRWEKDRFVFISANKVTTNGTFFNEKRMDVEEKIELNNNDIIGIGNTYHIKFCCMKLEAGGN